ncbi:MAG: hypothetical protein V2A74_09675, partial [bacterium]
FNTLGPLTFRLKTNQDARSVLVLLDSALQGDATLDDNSGTTKSWSFTNGVLAPGFHRLTWVAFTQTNFTGSSSNYIVNFTLAAPVVFDFDAGAGDWGFISVPSFFTAPLTAQGGGKIGLTSQSNSNTFGFWQGPSAVSVVADNLYELQWDVSSDVPDPSMSPQIRLRVNADNQEISEVVVASSSGDGANSPTSTPRTYRQFYLPPASSVGAPAGQDGFHPSFDLVNFDSGDVSVGTLYLEELRVVRYPLADLPPRTNVVSYEFEGDTNGWTYQTLPGFFSEPTSGTTVSALEITSTNNTDNFGYWQSPYDVQIAASQLYMARYQIHSSLSDATLVPEIRLRYATQQTQLAAFVTVDSLGAGASSPTQTPRIYDHYFLPPQNAVGTSLDRMAITFELINFGTDASTPTLTLERAQVDRLNLPSTP